MRYQAYCTRADRPRSPLTSPHFPGSVDNNCTNEEARGLFYRNLPTEPCITADDQSLQGLAEEGVRPLLTQEQVI
jgi:hypothetical protein